MERLFEYWLFRDARETAIAIQLEPTSNASGSLLSLMQAGICEQAVLYLSTRSLARIEL